MFYFIQAAPGRDTSTTERGIAMHGLHALGLGDILREVLEEKKREAEARDTAVEKMIRAGYSKDDVRQVFAHVEDLDGLAAALAGCIRLVDNARHEPSAKLAVELATYLRDSIVWMHGVMRRSSVDPEVFHLKAEHEGVTHMNKIISRMNTFIGEGQRARDLLAGSPY